MPRSLVLALLAALLVGSAGAASSTHADPPPAGGDGGGDMAPLRTDASDRRQLDDALRLGSVGSEEDLRRLVTQVRDRRAALEARHDALASECPDEGDPDSAAGNASSAPEACRSGAERVDAQIRFLDARERTLELAFGDLSALAPLDRAESVDPRVQIGRLVDVRRERLAVQADAARLDARCAVQMDSLRAEWADTEAGDVQDADERERLREDAARLRDDCRAQRDALVERHRGLWAEERALEQALARATLSRDGLQGAA